MAQQIQFGPFCLDEAERRLTREGETIHIEPKAFDLLTQLLRNAGRLVEKQELVERVWPDAIVTDNSLTRCIHQVRVALGDSVDHPEYIETVSGAGYRFISPVSPVDPDAGQPEIKEGYRRLPGRYITFLAIFLAVVLAWLAWDRTQTSHPPIQRLAVLPLTNLTGDPEQAYFVLGVHEALIAALSRIEAIDVISRTSVMRYAQSASSVPEIARELDVDAVVEGSVMRNGSELTVVAQLIIADPEKHLWSSQFDRSIGDVFELSAQIADSIAAEIEVDSPAQESHTAAGRRVVDGEAYDAYLQAKFKFLTKTRSDYLKAREMFDRAIRLDPEFADAYAGLAHTIGSGAIFGMQRPGDSFPRVHALATKALELDPDLEEGHLLLAGVSFYWERKFAEAERRLRRVLDLNPSSAHAYRMLAEVLSVTGRHEAALAAIEQGRRLDPLSPTAQLKPSLILYLKRDYPEAVRRARAGLDHFPEFWPGHWLLCRSLVAQGANAQALVACETAAQMSRRAPLVLGTLGYAYARAGESRKAEQILSELEVLANDHYVGAASLAIIHGALGRDDLAFAALRRAYRDHDLSLIHSAHSAEFDALRVDPRFQALQAEALAAN